MLELVHFYPLEEKWFVVVIVCCSCMYFVLGGANECIIVVFVEVRRQLLGVCTPSNGLNSDPASVSGKWFCPLSNLLTVPRVEIFIPNSIQLLLSISDWNLGMYCLLWDSVLHHYKGYSFILLPIITLPQTVLFFKTVLILWRKI